MTELTAKELREYLRGKHVEAVFDFDQFLDDADTFFKARAKAEEYFKSHRHLAKGRNGALPLNWEILSDILFPAEDTPPERLLTRIARECVTEMLEILADLRKVLRREREMVNLGTARQVDSQCLRWLGRQPGRGAVEKAGPKQRILAVVRKENYDTLENRIFKDFLLRTRAEANRYLREFGSKFAGHKTIKAVRHLSKLCELGLNEPLLEKVHALWEMPIPNFVLQQERRYSKIWKAYQLLARQSEIAERLWNRRQEVRQLLEKLRAEALRQVGNFFHTPIWFPPFNGKNELLENPYFEPEIRDRILCTKVSNKEADIVVNLTGNGNRDDLLIYGSRHQNAKPYLQDYDRPSSEDWQNPDAKIFRISDLFGEKLADDSVLHDYFEQLYARYGGKRWVVLVPDDWDALRQERVIKAIPLARSNVFLLWRSIAAAIGEPPETFTTANDGDTLALVMGGQLEHVGLCRLFFSDDGNGNLLPRRRSFLHHPECYEQVLPITIKVAPPKDFFLHGRRDKKGLSSQSEHTIRTFQEASTIHIISKTVTLLNGAKIFLKKYDMGEISYYDELEALSLIVQTPDERVLAKPLVEANEKSPGGKEIISPVLPGVARLKAGESIVNFYLCLGEAHPHAKLKLHSLPFVEILEENQSLDMEARMKPGQGMASVTVKSAFLKHPLELDFVHEMHDTDMTIAKLENGIKRSFPPDAPHVLASNDKWLEVRSAVECYLNGGYPTGDWFAKASQLYPFWQDLPRNASPLERLRRTNVFGNEPRHSFPTATFSFEILFKKLADDYESVFGKEKDQLARLIAWTYQSNFPAFQSIKRNILRKYSEYATGKSSEAPLYQEMTLLANLCNTPQEWAACLQAIHERMRISRQNKVMRDFYLLYNLLQFHTNILQGYSGETCWTNWSQWFPYWYNHYRDGKPMTYILKSLLYFLRLRRFDGKVFLTKEHDLNHYQIIAEMLSKRVDYDNEKLRKLVLDYLNGAGTIDGLPVD